MRTAIAFIVFAAIFAGILADELPEDPDPVTNDENKDLWPAMNDVLNQIRLKHHLRVSWVSFSSVVPVRTDGTRWIIDGTFVLNDTPFATGGTTTACHLEIIEKTWLHHLKGTIACDPERVEIVVVRDDWE